MAVMKPYPGVAYPGAFYPGIPSSITTPRGEEWEYVGDAETVRAVRNAAGKKSYSATVLNTVPGAVHEVELCGVELGYDGRSFNGARAIPEFTSAWSGTPNDSHSILFSESPVNYEPGSKNYLGYFKKTADWASNGERSLRIYSLSDYPFNGAGSTILNLVGLTPWKTYTFRCTVKVEKALIQPMTVSVGNEQERVTVESGLQPGTYELSVTFVATANDKLFLSHNNTYLEGGISIDSCAVQEGIAASFFSGDTPSDADLQYSWTGTPQVSQSVRTSTHNLVNYEAENCVVVQSSLWAKTMSYSARLINTDAREPGRAKIADLSEMEVGKTYTLSGTVTSFQRVQGVGFPYRSLALETNLGIQSESSMLTVDGETVHLTFTILPEMTEGGIYIYNGGIQGDPDVWWDSLILAVGSEPVPYFDGSYEGHEWLGEPNISASRRIPVAYRSGGWPLKKFYSSVADRLGEIEDLVARMTYFTADNRDLADLFEMSNEGRAVPIGATSDLVDPRTADAEWLPWIAQLTGANIDGYSTESEVRAALARGASGSKSGTRTAIATVVRSILTGPEDSREVRIYANSASSATIGKDSEWDLLVVTPKDNTPAIDIAKAVERAGVKPAGIVLHHEARSTTWAQLQTKRPKWAEWNDRTWRDIEETGY